MLNLFQHLSNCGDPETQTAGWQEVQGDFINK